MADQGDLEHLLRRTEFVARPSRLAELAPLTIADAVDDVLAVSANGNPTPPGNLLVDDPQHRSVQIADAINWWVGNMVSLPRPVQEKMTLFWHGHFTTAISDGVSGVDLMMRQNQTYRTLAMGKLLPLAHAMAIEPAMLLYLSGATNVKSTPNENFARELMELFTLGIGNYTQDDVIAAARAWTGHNVVNGQYVFRADQHDAEPTTFFGTTRAWNGPDIIDEILRDNAAKRAVAARFIAGKLWGFFAHPGPPAAVLDALTTAFLSSDLDVPVLLRTMFNRPEFYSDQAKFGLVRTPTDFAAAMSSYTGIDAKTMVLHVRGYDMGQALFDPPNVAGWRQNGYWLTTSALSARAVLAREVASASARANAFDYIRAMSANDAANALGAAFGIRSWSAPTFAALTAAFDAEPSIPKTTDQLVDLVSIALLSPEFHLA